MSLMRSSVVAPNPPVPRIIIVQQPAGVLAGVLLTTQPKVRIVDAANGNAPIPMPGVAIRAEVTGLITTLLGTAIEVTDATGLATWDDMIVVGALNVSLTFWAGPYGNCISDAFLLI